MQVITRALLEAAGRDLQENPKFQHKARALTATITFQDELSSAYLVFFRGKLLEIGEGVCPFGSEFIITAANRNWERVFEDERQGIYELNGDLISLEGDAFAFAGNAIAFREIWAAVRRAYWMQSGEDRHE